MSYTNNTYNKHIDRSYRQNAREMEWAKLLMYILLSIALIAIGGTGYWYYHYGFAHTANIQLMVLAAVGLFVSTLICCVANTVIIKQHAARYCAEDLLHFDLYHSNKESLGNVFAQATEHFNFGRRKVDSLAEMVAEAEKVSARYVRLKSQLDQIHNDMQTADKLRELIRSELSAQKLDDSDQAVVAFLERHAP